MRDPERRSTRRSSSRQCRAVKNERSGFSYAQHLVEELVYEDQAVVHALAPQVTRVITSPHRIRSAGGGVLVAAC